MGFQTYTCCICGKTGLTKRTSYSYKNGRACREHELAKAAANQRQIEADQNNRKVTPPFLRAFGSNITQPPTGKDNYDVKAIKHLLRVLDDLNGMTSDELTLGVCKAIEYMMNSEEYLYIPHYYLDSLIKEMIYWNEYYKRTGFEQLHKTYTLGDFKAGAQRRLSEIASATNPFDVDFAYIQLAIAIKDYLSKHREVTEFIGNYRTQYKLRDDQSIKDIPDTKVQEEIHSKALEEYEAYKKTIDTVNQYASLLNCAKEQIGESETAVAAINTLYTFFSQHRKDVADNKIMLIEIIEYLVGFMEKHCDEIKRAKEAWCARQEPKTTA